ncbi:unnamed protein product [Amoebophrya sp. A120]|nr:unnamed protein product [Amoebophrya sp. A120]|eukprot:GSA120T00019280001.1
MSVTSVGQEHPVLGRDVSSAVLLDKKQLMEKGVESIAEKQFLLIKQNFGDEPIRVRKMLRKCFLCNMKWMCEMLYNEGDIFALGVGKQPASLFLPSLNVYTVSSDPLLRELLFITRLAEGMKVDWHWIAEKMMSLIHRFAYEATHPMGNRLVKRIVETAVYASVAAYIEQTFF